jgi:acyl dehydratase
MSKYFEEFNDGDVYVTRGRTLTEADIMMYAGLCWDTQAEHTNAEFAKRGPFGERIGQQQLGLLIAHGLIDSLRLTEGTLISVLRLGWNYFNPMKIHDTLHVRLTVKEKKSLDVEGGGVITFEWETINQRDELIHRCQRTVLVARQTSQPAGIELSNYKFMGLSDLEPSTAERTPPNEKETQTQDTKQQQGAKGLEKKNRGKYYEEFEIGEELTTQARTVAEADTINYTILSWDTDPIHTDAVFGLSAGFGGTLAPLLMPIIFANGLGASLGFLAGTNRGALGDWWEFIRPLRIGDTLHFRQVISAKKDAKDKDTGIVTFAMEMVSEAGEVVSRGERSALVARMPRRPGDAEPWNFVFGTAEELAKE